MFHYPLPSCPPLPPPSLFPLPLTPPPSLSLTLPLFLLSCSFVNFLFVSSQSYGQACSNMKINTTIHKTWSKKQCKQMKRLKRQGYDCLGILIRKETPSNKANFNFNLSSIQFTVFALGITTLRRCNLAICAFIDLHMP